MFPLLYQWIDLLWLPVGLIAVHKGHRWMTAGFIIVCILTLRLQVDLMRSTGYETGFLPLMESDLYSRGLFTYGLIIMIFLLLAHFSPRTTGVIFFAATLSVYLLAFCLSMGLMAL